MKFDKLTFLDGGMGTMLQKHGLKSGEASDTQNLTNGKAVVEIHRQYIEAGADILTANTFGAYSLNHENFAEIIEAAVAHMREAISGADRKILMALDLGPTGKILEPYGDFEYNECYSVFLKSVQVAEQAGVDLVIAETMMDLNELMAAVSAVKTVGLPVIASMTFDKNGRTMMGVDVNSMAQELQDLEVDAIGMNCGFGPEPYEGLLSQLAAVTNLPIIVQPNAGLPEMVNGEVCYNMTPQEFAKSMERMKETATLLGGCCGTTPDHLREMVKLCRG